MTQNYVLHSLTNFPPFMYINVNVIFFADVDHQDSVEPEDDIVIPEPLAYPVA